jgi:hypothetical protein
MQHLLIDARVNVGDTSGKPLLGLRPSFGTSDFDP